VAIFRKISWKYLTFTFLVNTWSGGGETLWWTEKGIQILLVVTVLPEPTWSGSGGQPAELLIPEDAHLAAGCYTTHLATDVLSLLINLQQYFHIVYSF